MALCRYSRPWNKPQVDLCYTTDDRPISCKYREQMEHIGIIEKQWLKATKPTRIAGLLFLDEKCHARGRLATGSFLPNKQEKKKQRPRERERKKRRRGKILLEVLDMKRALKRLTHNVWSIAVFVLTQKLKPRTFILEHFPEILHLQKFPSVQYTAICCHTTTCC